MQIKLWVVVAIIVVFLTVIAFWAGRQFGYPEGASNTAEQMLAFPNSSNEVATLRAQLSEIRRSEDRLLSVVVASFAAGVGLLALINGGVLVSATLTLADQRARLLNDARDLVRSEIDILHSKADELDRRLESFSADVESALRPLKLSEFVRLATDARLGANPNPVESAVNLSRAVKLQTEMGQKLATSAFLPTLTQDLRNIPLTPGVHETVLDEMEEALKFVKKATPKDPSLNTAVNHALAEVQAIRDRQ
jgi:hypothetical protein